VFFKTYTQYVNDYRIALATLKRLSEENPNFVAFLKKLEDNPKTLGKTIKFFLIMPVQRIPRYTLLLKDLRDKTWNAHPDFSNLNQAYKKFLEITQFVEDSQEKSHQISKVIAIQSELVGRKAEVYHQPSSVQQRFSTMVTRNVTCCVCYYRTLTVHCVALGA
jgi:hypothetical protein